MIYSKTWTVGTFPTILSQSILMFGLWTILDPLGIMIVDACLGRFQNDQSFGFKKPLPVTYKHFRCQATSAEL